MATAARRTIRLPIFIHAPPGEVFRHVSDPARLTRWLVDRATLVPRTGGDYVFTWEGGPTHSGTVLEYVKGRSIALTWGWPGREKLGVTTLTISLEGRAGGTVVRFTHAGFRRGGPWVDLYEGALRGWTYFMMNLKSVVENGHDLRSPYDW
jgi:uncharacterized protein YndB with AHSA1/START domain